MYYWNFINMKYVTSKVREAMEDIFLILNQEWEYNETRETQKMLKMFQNSEEILEEVMAMQVSLDSRASWLKTDNSGKPDKVIDCPKNPEKILDELQNIGDRMFGPAWSEEGQEKIDILAVFVTKMAVYRFCKTHFPRILSSSSKEIDEEKIDLLENEMEKWEKQFWTVWVSHAVEVDFYCSDDLFSKRKLMRRCYELSKDKNRYDKVFRCVERALEDEEIVKAVKEMQNGSFSFSENKDYNDLKEIHNMKHLLDIMERSIKGELTEQDKTELRGNVQDWSRDIEALTHMIKQTSK